MNTAASTDDKSRSAAQPTRLKFWGVRGSIPTPGPTTVQYGGNTSCVEVRADGQIIILDAGTGLRLLGQQLVAEFDAQPLDATLLLTHTHWDHIQGLPFFMPVYKPQHHLRILGYEGARHGLEVVLAGQMESPFFPIGLREVPANVRIEELKEMKFTVGRCACRPRWPIIPAIASATACSPRTARLRSSPTTNSSGRMRANTGGWPRSCAAPMC